MTTREERHHHKQIIKSLEGVLEIARKDEGVATSPEDNAYYTGLGDAYEFAIKLCKGLKT